MCHTSLNKYALFVLSIYNKVLLYLSCSDMYRANSWKETRIHAST